MINLKIICVGKIKEKPMKEVINEYIKKLSKFSKTEVFELMDEKIPDNASLQEIEKIKNIESNKILNIIDKIGKTNIFLCDLSGKEYNSIEFSNIIKDSLQTSSTITFIIGGSLGVNQELKQRANKLVCFSRLTFPHQLFRIFLVEQIYRSFKIINNETYHK